jgi:UDP-N-acetylmuramoyl-L-alanyl-D-glutamate--2,6-diaminopimelate ligase
MKISGIEIKGITCNSKDIRKGFVFVAIRGNRQDGSCFIKEAISNGASIVVVQGKIKRCKISGETKLITVKDCRNFLAEISAEFYDYPSDNLKVVGITGTNGKTTISYLIEAMAKEAGYDCGVIGTINYRFKGKIIAAKNTTPGPVELQGLCMRSVLNIVRWRYLPMLWTRRGF